MKDFFANRRAFTFLVTQAMRARTVRKSNIATSIAFRWVADCRDSLRLDVLVSAVTLVTNLGKDFFACGCDSNFLFTQTNELAQIQGKVLAGFKVVLQEILMDIRSSMVRSSLEQILGGMVQCWTPSNPEL